MIVATYARKSPDEGNKGESVARQVALSRAFIERQGWRVAEGCVFVDDNVSGGDFVRRGGLARLLVAATSTPRPFDAVVMMDESRLGRDQYRTGYVLQQLADAEVEVWFYQESRRAKLDDATGKFLESVRGFAAEMEREKAKARTREALRQKAKRGHVAGGDVYGYGRVRHGSHVQRVINEAEAAVVRRIFQRAAARAGAPTDGA